MKEHLFGMFNLVSALSILWMEMSARYKYLHYYYFVSLCLCVVCPFLGRWMDI